MTKAAGDAGAASTRVSPGPPPRPSPRPLPGAEALARLRQKSWWPWCKRGVTLIFFAAVAWLMVRQAHTIAWGDVLKSVAAMPSSVLMGAAALTLLTYGMYCTFDLVGRYCAGHALRIWQVAGIGFISYAFNLNLGTLVGGVAFRYRLYGRLGLDAATITQVTALSMLTNWIGYCLLSGLVFCFWPPALPQEWGIAPVALRCIGAALCVVALSYVGLCAWLEGRDLRWRGRSIPAPRWPVAVLQLGLSSAHWMLMAGIVYMLLQQRVGYPAVLAAMLVSAIAGVIAHVPAGLGVLEAVFVSLLDNQLPKNDILAALLGYRAIYYLAPLLLATAGYFLVETRTRNRAAAADTQQSASAAAPKGAD